MGEWRGVPAIRDGRPVAALLFWPGFGGSRLVELIAQAAEIFSDRFEFPFRGLPDFGETARFGANLVETGVEGIELAGGFGTLGGTGFHF